MEHLRMTGARGNPGMSITPATSILLVEDDLRLADLVSRYLESNGFTVAIVSRGDEVVSRVERGSQDLVILDLGLPGEDGLYVCRFLCCFFSCLFLFFFVWVCVFVFVLG